jgi:hypothetical protein
MERNEFLQEAEGGGWGGMGNSRSLISSSTKTDVNVLAHIKMKRNITLRIVTEAITRAQHTFWMVVGGTLRWIRFQQSVLNKEIPLSRFLL